MVFLPGIGIKDFVCGYGTLQGEANLLDTIYKKC